MNTVYQYINNESQTIYLTNYSSLSVPQRRRLR